MDEYPPALHERPADMRPRLRANCVIFFRMLGDIKSARWLYIKAMLLLGVAVWGFCRAYYFAFYVVEHYADRNFKFAGLIAFVTYIVKRSRSRG